ncbi:MAG TPA: cupredoxin domain-containing protein [Candidatus Limnocylindria bacterium]|nr:cupredoxin domain-containing protein [Candidatus Limnocylindria bacterium]
MRALRITIAAAVVTAAVAGLQQLASGTPDPLRVEITIRYSGFEPSALSVPRGVPVTFVLVNRDPIGHEWLIGDESFHDRHRHGTEPKHGERPNEVTIPPLGRTETTLTFERSGTVRFICHLPGHEAYGMVGVLTVT